MSPATNLPSTRKHWPPGCDRADELDGDVAHADLVAAAVLDQVGVGRLGDPLHPLGLVGLHVDRHGMDGEQLPHAGDLVPRHVTADVVGVVVGGEGADQAHAVGVQQLEDVLHAAVGGVDDNGVTRLAVADEVDAVDHLAGERIAGGDVPPREQLLEVEAVLVHGGSGYGLDTNCARRPGRRRRTGRTRPGGCRLASPLAGAPRAGADRLGSGGGRPPPRRTQAPARSLIAPLEGGHQGRHLGPQPLGLGGPAVEVPETGRQARGVLTDVGSKGSALGGHYVTVAG